MRPQINSEPKKRGPVPTVKALLLLLVLLFLFVCFFFFVFGSRDAHRSQVEKVEAALKDVKLVKGSFPSKAPQMNLKMGAFPLAPFKSSHP